MRLGDIEPEDHGTSVPPRHSGTTGSRSIHPGFRMLAMADKKPFESLTGIEQEVQITERTKHAMEDYFGWLQKTMTASPWSNIDLNKNF